MPINNYSDIQNSEESLLQYTLRDHLKIEDIA